MKNREILFRGKRVDNGEWVYGDLVRQGSGWYIEQHVQDRPNKNFKVIPETVGQFTGLTDKNGTKIFEGDILSENNGSPMEIVWQEYSCQWIAKYTQKEGRGYRDISHRYCPEYKITGNIHDNPTT